MSHHLPCWFRLSVYGLLAICCSAVAFAETTHGSSKSRRGHHTRWSHSAHRSARSSKTAKPAHQNLFATPEDTPWKLRSHYTSTSDGASLLYADDDADWALAFADGGTVVKHAGFKITLGDGTVLTAADLGKGVPSRKHFETPLGAGRLLMVGFQGKNGLKVRHSMSMYTSEPYLTIQLEVTNTGTKPIEIRGLTPVNILPGNLENLGEHPQLSQRRMAIHGPFLAYDSKAPSLLTLIHDAEHRRILAMGLLPTGIAEAGVRVDMSGASGRAEAGNTFAPAVRLAPGKTLKSDAVWLCYRLSRPSQVDMYYSWARTSAAHVKDTANYPNSWVTVDASDGPDKLYDAAKQWAAAGITHALVPAAWADGGASKQLAKVATKLSSLGVTPGIAVDPVLADSGDAAWSAPGPTGRVWLNLSNAAARERAATRLKNLKSAGYQFFAVAPSSVPDATLQQFNVTRPELETLAFATVAAAGATPVVAPPTCALDSELKPWLEAAAATSRMREDGVVSGAVRLDAGSVTGVDDSLAAAMTFYGGPIEIVGSANEDVLRRLATVFPRPAIHGRPLDAAHDAPTLWQIHATGAADGYRGDAVVMFPGAPAWKVSDLDRNDQQPVKIWQASTGQFVAASSAIPASDHFAIYGVIPDLNRPSLMGATPRIDLGLEDLLALSWSGNTGLLKGEFDGESRKPGMAYVYVPAGWSLKSGVAGGARISAPKGSSVIEFPVEAGATTRFELSFLRR